MTPTPAHRTGTSASLALALLLAALALSSCSLDSLPHAAVMSRVVSGRCAFLGSSSSSFVGCNYTRTNDDSADAPSLNFNLTTWTSAQLDGVQMPSSSFVRADFAHARLTSSDFEGDDFDGASFVDARLVNSLFDDSTFVRANFTGASLNGARSLEPSDLSGATWHDTICPDGSNSNLDHGTCLDDLTP